MVPISEFRLGTGFAHTYVTRAVYNICFSFRRRLWPARALFADAAEGVSFPQSDASRTSSRMERIFSLSLSLFVSNARETIPAKEKKKYIRLWTRKEREEKNFSRANLFLLFVRATGRATRRISSMVRGGEEKKISNVLLNVSPRRFFISRNNRT